MGVFKILYFRVCSLYLPWFTEILSMQYFFFHNVSKIFYSIDKKAEATNKKYINRYINIIWITTNWILNLHNALTVSKE